jgi:formate C-acetyltransferase
LGGMEIQFNVVTDEVLRKAKESPEEYRNLLVRVSGFSAYFTALEENLQNEIIERTMHQI